MGKPRLNYSLSRRQRKSWRWLRLVLFGLLLLMTTSVLLAFVFRNQILDIAIQKVIKKAHNDYKMKFKIQKAEFVGISSLHMTGISLVPENNDTLLTLKEFDGALRIWPLLTGNVSFSTFKPNDLHVRLVKYDSVHSNYQQLLNRKKKESSSENEPSTGKSVYRAVSRLFEWIPEDVNVNNWTTDLVTPNSAYQVVWRNSELKNSKAKGECTVVTPWKKHSYALNGHFDPDDMTGDFSIASANKNDTMELPAALKKFGLKVQAGALHIQLKEVDYEDGFFKVNWSAGYEKLNVNHKRLSDKDVFLPSGKGDFNCRFNGREFYLDSSSTWVMEKIQVHPYIYFQRKPVWTLGLKLHTPSIQAQDFFQSLPQGMFESLEGIRVAGNVKFYLDFQLSDTNPYQCQYDAGLITQGFKVNSYGSQYIPRINGPFIHTPYEYGHPVRPIDVSESSNDYWPIDEIHPFIVNAVITSEDPGFYGHRGFEMESIRQSIAQNFKAKRFVRGASTLTMQLVKNVFLSRKKTLSRKVEEMLIVWMIENLHLVSKQRMLEVYLNIIEWGPNVYGIGEACRYYFNKTPHDIQLNEAIFLSSVIPSPKSFSWIFTDSASIMKKSWQNHINRMANIMAARKLVEESDTLNFSSDVRLTGPAMQRLRKKKTEVIDSIPPDMDEIILKEPEY